VQEYIPGQRWISDAELKMGLGTILSVDHRSVTVLFLATGETRTYSKQTAPLTRVRFAPGDSILSHDDKTMTVLEVIENEGLLSYRGLISDGAELMLDEGQLSNFIQLDRPADRLFSGQIDNYKWFNLRVNALDYMNQLAQSDVAGLVGARTSLIPHQLFIANEVATRYAPRVLLADEVGLGKTIEAGLILHHQIHTERAKRVLIVLPESLVHQWLVEMIRRFNLQFSVFDESRCAAVDESENGENPFETEQLIITNIEFLRDTPQRFLQLSETQWDLLVVDEAHHLQWSPQQASVEYQIVEQLAAQTKGVLLLTATPEQLGKESHFARLRLLDPSRFPSFEQFIQEEQEYKPIADAIDVLLSGETLGETHLANLQKALAESDNQALLAQLIDGEADQAVRHELIDHLLDRHGTGRVLFRNTRHAIKGFPERELHSYALSLPEAYTACLQQIENSTIANYQVLLSSELLYQALGNDEQLLWTQFDPRIDWLIAQLKSLRPEKVLVITSDAGSALDIADVLRSKAGIHAAVFHEQMTLLERDRAAAYFADQEFGTQVLVCSEIGSEGRNFQFAHHLIMFDLPINPDLLEQRIGRLDRIGQAQTIQIHVPYLDNSPQAIMLQWYHQGLNAFLDTCPAGYDLFKQVEKDLLACLHDSQQGLLELPGLIKQTKQLSDQANELLQQGRDRLFEYHSCRPQVAANIQDSIQQQDLDPALAEFLEQLFDCYGVESEIDSAKSLIIRPGHHAQSESFLSLAEDGMTITYDRETALANEDMQFVTWEHPMVTAAFEMISSSEIGNTSVVTLDYKQVKAGTLLLEALFVLESASSQKIQSSRYLPPTSLRIVLDEHGRNHADVLSAKKISENLSIIEAQIANKIVRTKQTELRNLVQQAEQHAQTQSPEILQQAQTKSFNNLSHEIDRLQALKAYNPNIREDEIEFFQSQLADLKQTISDATLRLDAIRVVIAV